MDSFVARAVRAPEYDVQPVAACAYYSYFSGVQHGTAGAPGYLRKPYGNGWALVGDASYNRDPITAQGISEAFIDAEMLVDALNGGLSGNGGFAESLAAHESARHERVRAMYEFTTRLAALEPPPPEMQAPFGALRGNQAATDAFLSAITGAIPLSDSMSHDHISRIMAAANHQGEPDQTRVF